MNPGEGSRRWPTILVVDGARSELDDSVVVEEPLEIQVAFGDEAPRSLSLTMRTPGDDEALAVGLLFAEGILQERRDLETVEWVPDPSSDSPETDQRLCLRLRADLPRDRLGATRNFIMTSACGVCGKTAVDATFAAGIRSLPVGSPRLRRAVLENLPETMRAGQALFARTGGIHAAALFDLEGGLLDLAEDVGRHNAVDRIVGRAFAAATLPLSERVLAVSGRVGFEIVQKALRAGVPILAAVGAPTHLALRAAARGGMTVAGFVRAGRANLYTASERIDG